MLTVTEVLVLVASFVGLVAVHFFSGKKNWDAGHSKSKKLPPGPWGFPIVGHIPFFGSNPAKKFLQWKKLYGPIFSVRFGSVPAIVLNDYKSIKEALSMQQFSGRPLIPVMVQISNRRGIVFTDGPKQVEQRKFAIKTLKEFGVGSPLVELRALDEIASFLSSLKSRVEVQSGKPMKMNKLFRFSVINALWDSIMGERFEETDPTLLNIIKLVDKGTDTNSSLIAQLFWFFPWVAALGNLIGYNPPVYGFQSVYKYMEKQIEKARKVYVKGQLKYFTDAYFDKVAETTDPHSSFHESGKQQAISTADILMAASDTTITILDWLTIYLARDEKIQRNLQYEIDTVVGVGTESRTPCLNDRHNMPYTEAVILELLRITTIVPFAMFHRTLEPVEFKGYRIPKDTMVIPNIYAVHKDPEVWEKPDEFDPRRFLDDAGRLKKSGEVEIAPFNLGRRACLGEAYARDQLFLITTNFFKVFSVSCGKKVPSLEPVFGIVLYPQDFELIVNVR